MKPVANAFTDNPVQQAPTGTGLLDGLRFGAKDVFDVAGHVTGCGNPDWRRTHAPAVVTASAITRLLDAGARLLGKTQTDELAYSLNGENAHDGTPENPRAPGRIPGGSSSGSASAVAQDRVDIAMGTDCGGSVRVPASFCGLFGMRPTHGRIATDGLVPLAPSFDTVGWFAASADHLLRVGRVLLPEDAGVPPSRLVIATDLFAQLGNAQKDALAPAIERLKARVGSVEHAVIGDTDPDVLMRAFRTLQAAEIWAVHGDWITRTQPSFGPGVQERFQQAAQVQPQDVAAAQSIRAALQQRMAALLTPRTIICLPTVPGIAPLRDTPAIEMEAFRSQAMRMLCIAGLTGAPQISMPVTLVDGCPLGLSVMGARDSDLALLAFVEANDVRDAGSDGCEIDLPEVLAEVRAAFARYEHALTHNEVAVLDHLFRHGAQTVRYGATENLVGFDQIRAFRLARPTAGLMRTLHNTVITTFGRDTASACTEFTRAGSHRIGRQTQTWIRTPAGWKVVAAHVSLIDPPASDHRTA